MSSDTKGSRKPDRPIYQPGVLLAYTSNLFYNTLLVIVDSVHFGLHESNTVWCLKLQYVIIRIYFVLTARIRQSKQRDVENELKTGDNNPLPNLKHKGKAMPHKIQSPTHKYGTIKQFSKYNMVLALNKCVLLKLSFVNLESHEKPATVNLSGHDESGDGIATRRRLKRPDVAVYVPKPKLQQISACPGVLGLLLLLMLPCQCQDFLRIIFIVMDVFATANNEHWQDVTIIV